jgi:acyl-CoA synthetase (AMP-forming)/AMP-acid ligase II
MDGLMMDFPLTLSHLFDRVGLYFGKTELVSRRPDKSIHRTTYGEFHRRAQKLANALQRLGLRPGDRVATLAWNHSRHLEAYFAVPLAGGVLHTLNPRLSPQDLTYIMNHADDRVLIVDDVLLPVFERFRHEVHPRHVIVWGKTPEGMIDYEQLIEPEIPTFTPPRIEENQAAGICYTSGTTGKPKGVLYNHRAIVLHSLASALPDALNLGQTDVILPVVPMFHVNAWGLPFTAAMVGAKLVFPGPHLDAANLLPLLAEEKVTCAAGVPTVWLALLEALDKAPGAWDLKSLKQMVVGGSAAPPSMIEGYQKRHGLKILHAWGMTEMSPIGTVCRLKPQHASLPEPERPVGRQVDGRASSPRPLGGEELFPEPGRGRQVHRRRLVPHGRHRHPRSRGVHPHHRPEQGSDQVGRRVDQLGRAGERPDGTPRGERGGGGGGEASEMGRAARGVRGAQGGCAGHAGGAARLSGAALRQVLAARRVRLLEPDPAHRDGQVPQERPARPAQGLQARLIRTR